MFKDTDQGLPDQGRSFDGVNITAFLIVGNYMGKKKRRPGEDAVTFVKTENKKTNSGTAKVCFLFDMRKGVHCKKHKSQTSDEF